MLIDMPQSEPLDAKTFDAFRRLIYQHSGICLSDAKVTLVRARIGKRMRALGLSDHRAYLRHVEEDESGMEVVSLLDAISTNVTSFFREAQHFDILANHLNERQAAGQTRLRIWSAACSTGEEPHSIALSACESLPLERCDLRILASDINTQVLAACAAGRFGEESLKPVPKNLRLKYFTRTGELGPKGPVWQATQALRRLIVPKRLNLSRPPFPLQGPLDAVFCRNVMIYFDNDVRRALLHEITRLLPRGGLLFVGHAESLTGMHCGLRCLRPSVYVKD